MHTQFGLVAAALLIGPVAIADSFYVAGSVGVSMIDDTAAADSRVSSQPGVPPAEISLNGLAFESDETAYGVAIGWQARNWLAVELGYTNLGEAEWRSQFPVFSIFTPTFAPVPLPPGVIPGGAVSATPLMPDGPTLGIEELSLAARFSASLTQALSANWSVGITHVQFDADGEFVFFELVTPGLLAFNPVEIPYASPDNEIGYNFGFGFEWAFNDRFSADIGYRRHDTQVIDVDTVTLRLILSL